MIGDRYLIKVMMVAEKVKRAEKRKEPLTNQMQLKKLFDSLLLYRKLLLTSITIFTKAGMK